MTKEELLEIFKNYLTEYASYEFIFHKEFIKELAYLATNVSYQDVFLNQLATILRLLREHKYNIIT